MTNISMISNDLEVDRDIRLNYNYYVNAGAKETLVFIHAHSVDQRMWAPQVQYFAYRYSILSYDLRGYGLSSLPREGQPFLHANDLLMLLQHLDIKKVHLVGLSLGSFVALDFWSLYPEYVYSVTVASGAIPDPKPTEPEALVTDIVRFKQKWFARLLEGCGDDRNGYRDKLWMMIADWTGWQVMHNESEALSGEKLTSQLLAIKNPEPVCIVNGLKDFEGAHRSAERLLQCMPHARSVNLPEAGHFSNMETPNEFNLVLNTFLNNGGNVYDSQSYSSRL